jgi:hypothetical protein
MLHGYINPRVVASYSGYGITEKLYQHEIRPDKDLAECRVGTVIFEEPAIV